MWVFCSMLWDVVHSEAGVEWFPDPAPSVTLHCQDTEATRALWPHRFEIFYKITLGETDEFGDIGVSSKEQRAIDERLEDAGSLERLVELHEEDQRRKEEKELQQKRFKDPDAALPLVDVPDPIKDHIPTQLRLQIAVINRGRIQLGASGSR